ncbi:MAG TPA: hypothetical protein VMN60_05055 [Longimicrobiales bacterium]|nr:hypothetical protein [Longimicrobiales bacterium]
MRKLVFSFIVLLMLLLPAGAQAQCADCEDDFSTVLNTEVHRMLGEMSEYSVLCDGGGGGHAQHECDGTTEEMYSVGECNMHEGCGEHLLGGGSGGLVETIAAAARLPEAEMAVLRIASQAPQFVTLDTVRGRAIVRNCGGEIVAVFTLQNTAQNARRSDLSVQIS